MKWKICLLYTESGRKRENVPSVGKSLSSENHVSHDSNMLMKRKHYLHWDDMTQIIIGKYQIRGIKI